MACFGHLVHGHTQLLRHVAQHREDSKASQDASDGIAQSDNEGVSVDVLMECVVGSKGEETPKAHS